MNGHKVLMIFIPQANLEQILYEIFENFHDRPKIFYSHFLTFILDPLSLATTSAGISRVLMIGRLIPFSSIDDLARRITLESGTASLLLNDCNMIHIPCCR